MSDERVWIPATEVRAGDLLAHKLRDTPWTYTRVTGWSDRYLATSGVTLRTFTVTDAPWWVDETDLTADLAREVLVMTRGSLPQREPEAAGSSGQPEDPGPVTRVIAGDALYGYRMPVPSRFTNDLLASLDERWAVLESIGIARREDATPLGAWRDAVADESGVPRPELDPAQGGRFDAGFTPAYVRKFIAYLA